MKKLGLILVCTMLMAIFIAFNYLLWDRESKVKSIDSLSSNNMSSSAAINSLEDKIKSLEDDNEHLKASIADLEKDNKDMEAELEKKDEEKAGFENELRRKSEIIDGLKIQADIKPLENTVKKWVESIGHGFYEEAYGLMDVGPAGRKRVQSLEEFADMYKKSVEGMELKGLKFQHGDGYGGTAGNIIFLVNVEVKLLEKNSRVPFENGTNEKYFILVYSKEKSKWLISGISNNM